MKNNPIKTLPVARFFYKGNHTHPVRRTVVLVESTKTYLLGFEVREGSEVRKLRKSPIKRYNRAKIAKVRNIDKRRKLKRIVKNTDTTTLVRKPLINLLVEGA
jgi:chemotaxis signal transduction protein